MSFDSVRLNPIHHQRENFTATKEHILQDINKRLPDYTSEIQSESRFLSSSLPQLNKPTTKTIFEDIINRVPLSPPPPHPESILGGGSVQQVSFNLGFLEKDLKKAIKQADSFEELKPIVERAKSNLSFWGTRYITADGYKGYVSIDAIAKRTRELIEAKPDYDKLEREYGTIIAGPIDNIYRSSDEDVVKSNWFTRLIVKVRKVVYQILTLGSGRCGFTKTRWNWHECELVAKPSETKGYFRIFQYYTSNQYGNVFGKQPEGPSKKLNGLKGIYWLAPKQP